FTSGKNFVPISTLNSSLNAGIYFVELRSEKGVNTIRFVKN
ncbi:MAG: hypothetical protein ACI9LA_002261, partial [Bacteroidia bacterium]